jgi:hypothetical protein
MAGRVGGGGTVYGGSVACLLLGPIVRHVGWTDASIWVETDRPGTVAVLGCRAPTFTVAGHHYALVRVRGLEAGCIREYRVELDGEVVWPEPGSRHPPSMVRTLGGEHPVRLLFGSCRLARPHTPPYTLAPDQHDEGRGVDALTAVAVHLRHRPAAELPDLVLHLGDQVYSDEPPAPVLDFVRSRRPQVPGPAGEVVDFEEFARLYRDAWSDPDLRWLLSTVPNAMMFDDHDVHDDWNTSLAWREARDRLPWWRGRMEAALMAVWIYQHVGNLDPRACAEEGVLDLLEAQPGDATAALRDVARRAHLHPHHVRWSCRWDLGRGRLLLLDSRAGRVLEPGRRDMLDAAEWSWLEEQARGEAGHLLVASTVPVLLPGGLHDLEAWSERICDGAWGGVAAGLGERLRQALDLEHWAAFGAGFRRLAGLLRATAAGERGPAPQTICLLGGDVHFGYVAEVEGPTGGTTIHQLVASPLRNRLEPSKLRVLRASLSGAVARVSRLLARLAGVPPAPVRWRMAHGPWFENHVAELVLDARRATLAVREAQAGRHPELRMRLLVHLEDGAQRTNGPTNPSFDGGARRAP